HLDAADAASAAMALEEVVLIPAHDQPLRVIEPRASVYQRFAMTVLAVEDRPECHVSDMELVRQGRSYTADTLRALHASGRKGSQLFFILGTDAFAGIAAWQGYPGFLDLAHFVVIARPGMSLEDATRRTPKLPKSVMGAVHAVQDKKAVDVVVLDLRKAGGFTDYFVICTGTNPRQITAIADSVEERLRVDFGERPHLTEGVEKSQWILLDYFN